MSVHLSQNLAGAPLPGNAMFLRQLQMGYMENGGGRVSGGARAVQNHIRGNSHTPQAPI